MDVYSPYGRTVRNRDLRQVDVKATEANLQDYARPPPRRRRAFIIILIVLMILVIIGVLIWAFLRRRALANAPSTGTITGEKCTADSDCVSDRKCKVSTGFCVECLNDDNCDSPIPFCNTGTNVCVQCNNSGNCPSGTTCNNGNCCTNVPPVITSSNFSGGTPYLITGSYTFSQSVPGTVGILEVFREEPGDDVLIYSQTPNPNLGSIFLSERELCSASPGQTLRATVKIRSPCGTTDRSNSFSFVTPSPSITMLLAYIGRSGGQFGSCDPRDGIIKAQWTIVPCATQYELIMTQYRGPNLPLRTAIIGGLTTDRFDGNASSITSDPPDPNNFMKWCHDFWLSQESSSTIQYKVRATLIGGGTIESAYMNAQLLTSNYPCC